MQFVKVGLTIFFLLGILVSWGYSLVLIAQFLQDRLSKKEAIKRTFIANFGGILSIFFAYSIWQTGWSIGNWIGFLILTGSFSFAFAVFSTASFWFWRK